MPSSPHHSLAPHHAPGPTAPEAPALADPRVAFERHRPRLFALAYRMLGTRADAEDAVQDAYLRWHAADRAALQNPDHWLVTVISRLCIDRLRRAASERAAYVGPWLPEPLPADALPPDHALERT
ncbi:MAG TPA: sigma factor, partial [Polyangiaceae bacterium]|nr:sigma factor [Polyangiaceae bacterium]